MTGLTLGDLFIVPDIDRPSAAVSFTSPEGCHKAAWVVTDGEGFLQEGDGPVRPGEAARFNVPMDDFRLWNVQSPVLYTLRLTLEVKGEPVEFTQNFGMRTVRVSGRDILVNNEKFYARGYIRGREAHDHPNLENLPLEEYYAKNIRAAKDYGFNLIRFHSRIPPEECFEAADRLGIFIHVEIRKYFGKYQKERANMRDDGEIIDEQEWREAILRLRNHPSLMVYCMGNEIRHPGANPFVEHIAKVTKELDPTRLFLDTCAHGEFDRTYVDFDVQHMSYYYPFGRNYDMFENTYNWLIYGSCTGLPLVDEDDPFDPTYRVTRAVPLRRPTLAHEICHYAALRDLDALEAKFDRTGADKPWWIGELKKLVRLKGLEEDFPLMREASKRFQFASWKLGIEACRRSRLLAGFHFLQLSDTERYENSNGVVDCFDDPTGVDEQEFLKFNGDAALLADLPRRTFFEGEKVKIPVLVSHFSPDIAGEADFAFALESKDGDAVSLSGQLARIPMDERGLREVCTVEVAMPRVAQPQALRLVCRLTSREGTYEIENDWNLWLFPNRPEDIPETACTVALDEVDLARRYPQIRSQGSLDAPENLLVANRFGPQVVEHLRQGGDVLMLYRVPETRDRKHYPRGERPPKEEYYLPAVWDRMKGVIWDRGNNLGAFARSSEALAGFPHDGFLDLQFAGLVDDADKVVLDDFPAPAAPILQGVDRASRDRYDVKDWGMRELEPDWTMRKFAYLFEARVGAGRLFVSGFNFTGLNANVPETCAMFESVLRYVTSDAFDPEVAVSPDVLEDYLLAKGRSPRIRERKMTQYWQLDEEPLESARYWQEALEYLKESQ